MEFSLTRAGLEQQPRPCTVCETQVAAAQGASSPQLSAEAPHRATAIPHGLGKGTTVGRRILCRGT